jgi:hypothetical protein
MPAGDRSHGNCHRIVTHLGNVLRFGVWAAPAGQSGTNHAHPLCFRGVCVSEPAGRHISRAPLPFTEAGLTFVRARVAPGPLCAPTPTRNPIAGVHQPHRPQPPTASPATTNRIARDHQPHRPRPPTPRPWPRPGVNGPAPGDAEHGSRDAIRADRQRIVRATDSPPPAPGRATPVRPGGHRGTRATARPASP